MVGSTVVVDGTTDVLTEVTTCPHVGAGGVVVGGGWLDSPVVVVVGAGSVVRLVIVVGMTVVVGGTHVGFDVVGGRDVVGGGLVGVVVGTGGGGTAGGAGASAALGAPIGTVLSGTCMIPLR